MIVAALFVLASASAPTDAEVSERLQFIEQRLEAATPRAQAWFGLWTAAYGGVTTFQAIELAVAHDKEARVSAIVGGLGALVGTLSMVVQPMPAAFVAWRLRSVSAQTADERRHKLELAERFLTDAAAGELFERSWIVQAGGIVVTIALGLILEAGFRYFQDAVLNTFIGTAIAQTQVNTSPLQAARDREAYAQRFGLQLPETKTFFWHFDVYPGGVGVAGSF